MAKVTVVCPMERIETLSHAHTVAVEVDDVLVIGGRVCVAYADFAANEKGEWIHRADEVDVPKAAVAIAAGEIMYWDAAASLFTNVLTGNTKCGMFLEAAASGDATARALLDNRVNL